MDMMDHVIPCRRRTAVSVAVLPFLVCAFPDPAGRWFLASPSRPGEGVRQRLAHARPMDETSTTMNAPLPSRENMRIAVIGLGYVGLPLAVAFGRQFRALGFDINAKRVGELRQNHDHTLEVSGDELREAQQLEFTDEPAALKDCNVFLVTVPPPIDEYKRPDLRPLESASRTPATVPSASTPATGSTAWKRS